MKPTFCFSFIQKETGLHGCEGLKELTPVNVSNTVANQGTVYIATGDFSERSAGMGTGAVLEGAQSAVL